jgi:hypothetical protein
MAFIFGLKVIKIDPYHIPLLLWVYLFFLFGILSVVFDSKIEKLKKQNHD